MKKIVIAALLSAAFATPALADNSGRVYLAGDLGMASFTNANISINGTPNVFPNPGVVRIGMGFHVSPMIAIEAGYAVFGDSVLNGNAGGFTMPARSFQASTVLSLPLSGEFDVLGKIGVSSNSYTITTTGNAVVTSGGTGSRSDILLGVGAQYHLDRHMALRAQYESFGQFDNSTRPMSASVFSVGMTYDF